MAATKTSTNLDRLKLIVGEYYCIKNGQQPTTTNFRLREGDSRYPICKSGCNRSQVLRHVLVTSPTLSPLRPYVPECGLPHGAIHGCDPWCGYDPKQVVEENYFIYTHEMRVDVDTDPIHKAFVEAFGRRKCLRACEQQILDGKLQLNRDDYCQMPLTRLCADRQAARVVFEKEYYEPMMRGTPDNRHVLFVLDDEALDKIAARLLDFKRLLPHVAIVHMQGFEDEAAATMKMAQGTVRLAWNEPTRAITDAERTTLTAMAYRSMYRTYAEHLGLSCPRLGE